MSNYAKQLMQNMGNKVIEKKIVRMPFTRKELEKQLLKLHKKRKFLTLEDMKSLRAYDEISDQWGRPWRVTSVKTWKREPERVLVKLKHGMYDYDSVDETDVGIVYFYDDIISVKMYELYKKLKKLTGETPKKSIYRIVP